MFPFISNLSKYLFQKKELFGRSKIDVQKKKKRGFVIRKDNKDNEMSKL